MPLEPLPPPSPRGKKPSNPANPPTQLKHKCLASQPCPIRLSDIGKVHHTFPTGTFRTRYTPPLLPKFVLDYFSSNPFAWSWTTKSGPNAGKTFRVPSIPTSCRKSDHRVIRWTVDLFHSFKAHLSPRALDDKGRVPTPTVRIYQSNMLIHFRNQLKALTSTSPALPTLPPHSANPPPRQPADSAAQPPPKPKPKPPKTPTELEQLRAEVTRLRKQLASLSSKHPPDPISISPMRPPPKAHQSPPPSPPPPDSFSSMVSHPGFPDHPSLDAVFNHPGCPCFIRNLHPETTPLTSTFPPEDATHICEAIWSPRSGPGFSTEYYSLDSNGDLYISPNSNVNTDVTVHLQLDNEDGEEQEDADDVEFQLTPHP